MNPLYTSIIAAAVSAATSWVVSVKLKEREYKYEFYKKIIDKRMATYENLEKLLVLLKASSTDSSDKKSYHEIFFTKEKYDEAYQLHLTILRSGLWLGASSHGQLSEINKCFTLIHEKYDVGSASGLKEAGKFYFDFFSGARHNLEQHLRNELKNLHHVEEFLA